MPTSLMFLHRGNGISRFRTYGASLEMTVTFCSYKVDYNLLKSTNRERSTGVARTRNDRLILFAQTLPLWSFRAQSRNLHTNVFVQMEILASNELLTNFGLYYIMW